VTISRRLARWRTSVTGSPRPMIIVGIGRAGGRTNASGCDGREWFASCLSARGGRRNSKPGTFV
jgi:hypothetical protein